MTAKILIACLCAIVAMPALAADACPPNGRDVEWSAQCFEMKGGIRQIKAAFRNKLNVNRNGMTTIMITRPRELVAVDRRGRVVVPGIYHTGEFDYPNAENGIGRFEVVFNDRKKAPRRQCGYFKDADFKVVVPARFDACHPFRDGEAKVCKGCASYCNGPDCQHTYMVGGQSITLGTDGKVRRTATLPTLDDLCKPPAKLVTGKDNGGETWVRCDGSFDMPSPGEL